VYTSVGWYESGRQLTENAFIVDLLDDKPRPGRKHTDEDVKVEEERHPRRRLVLWHRRDYRNVDLCVPGVPQRVEAATPWRHVTYSSRFSSTKMSAGTEYTVTILRTQKKSGTWVSPNLFAKICLRPTMTTVMQDTLLCRVTEKNPDFPRRNWRQHVAIKCTRINPYSPQTSNE